MNQSQTISTYQPLLQAIALKMVGSLADAEDIVQDTLIKWLTIDTDKIKNTKAYLIKSVQNNCINHIEKLKKTKDEYLHNINAADIVDWYKEKEFFNFDAENELSAAFHVLQKKLEPLEKGIFVLRELFDVDYEELQLIFDKKKENCRKLFSRAKEKLGTDINKSKDTDSKFLHSFINACNFGSINDFIDKIKLEINAN